MRPRPDPYEYLDRWIDERADESDRLTDLYSSWPVDDYEPDDREPMAGDPLWREDE